MLMMWMCIDFRIMGGIIIAEDAFISLYKCVSIMDSDRITQFRADNFVYVKIALTPK